MVDFQPPGFTSNDIPTANVYYGSGIDLGIHAGGGGIGSPGGSAPSGGGLQAPPALTRGQAADIRAQQAQAKADAVTAKLNKAQKTYLEALHKLDKGEISNVAFKKVLEALEKIQAEQIKAQSKAIQWKDAADAVKKFEANPTKENYKDAVNKLKIANDIPTYEPKLRVKGGQAGILPVEPGGVFAPNWAVNGPTIAKIDSPSDGAIEDQSNAADNAAMLSLDMGTGASQVQKQPDKAGQPPGQPGQGSSCIPYQGWLAFDPSKHYNRQGRDGPAGYGRWVPVIPVPRQSNQPGGSPNIVPNGNLPPNNGPTTVIPTPGVIGNGPEPGVVGPNIIGTIGSQFTPETGILSYSANTVTNIMVIDGPTLPGTGNDNAAGNTRTVDINQINPYAMAATSKKTVGIVCKIVEGGGGGPPMD